MDLWIADRSSTFYMCDAEASRTRRIVLTHAIRILNITADIHKSFVDLHYTILQFRSLVGEKSKFSDVSGQMSPRIIIPKFRWNNNTLFLDMNEKVIISREYEEKYSYRFRFRTRSLISWK